MIPKAQSNAVIKYSKDKTNNQNLKSISKENTPIKNNPRNVLKNTYTELNSTYNIYLYKLNDSVFELEDNTVYSPLNAEVMYYTYQISKDNQLYDAINIYITLK